MAVQLSVDPPVLSEKPGPGPHSKDIPLNCRSSPHRNLRPSHHFIPMRTSSSSASSSSLSSSETLPQSQRYVRLRGLRVWNLFKQWLPILAYGATSLGFILAIAFWKTEVLDGKSSVPVGLFSGSGGPVTAADEYTLILVCVIMTALFLACYFALLTMFIF
jgi:hypothetical protein